MQFWVAVYNNGEKCLIVAPIYSEAMEEAVKLGAKMYGDVIVTNLKDATDEDMELFLGGETDGL